MTVHTRTASQPTLFWSSILLLIAILTVQPAAQASSPVFLVKNINPYFGSSPQDLADVNGTLYFRANDGSSPSTLWRSDGTEAGTQKADFGSNVVNPLIPFPFGGIFLLIANGSTSDNALFANDGSSSSTLLKDNFPFLGTIGAIGDAWYFIIGGATTELWKTDGTVAGTQKITTLPASSAYVPDTRVTFGNSIYFVVGSTLWKTDGTNAGTTEVKQFAVGVGLLTVVNSMLLFAANDGAHGAELWSSDGTPAGTVMVKDVTPGSASTFLPGPGHLLVAGNRVVFRVQTPSNALWSSNGTEQDTQPLITLSPFATEFAGNGQVAFFANQTSDAGVELWKSDGTVAGTQQVLDQNPGTMGAQPYNFAIVDRNLVYQTLSGEIWMSNGTEAGTMRISEPFSTSTANYGPFVASGNYVFFSAIIAGDGPELYAFQRMLVSLPTIYLPVVIAP